MRSIKISHHIKKTLCGAKIVSRETFIFFYPIKRGNKCFDAGLVAFTATPNGKRFFIPRAMDHVLLIFAPEIDSLRARNLCLILYNHNATFPARRDALDAARFCFFVFGRAQEPAARRPIFFAVFSI